MIIIDIEMLKMDGYRFIKLLKENLKSLDVFVMIFLLLIIDDLCYCGEVVGVDE